MTESAVPGIKHVPYAPAKSVLEVLRRNRETSAPNPLTPETVLTVGVPKSMGHRTVAAIRFLDLVDEGGRHTDTFARLKAAASDEYPQALAEVVQAAYLEVFAIVDPSRHDVGKIEDAFRGFEPSAQRESMVTLFLNLCLEAEIIDKVPARTRTARQRSEAKPRSQVTRSKPSSAQQKHAPNDVPVTGQPHQVVADLAVLSALIQRLPRERHWSVDERGRWLAAFTANIDLIVEQVEGPAPSIENSDGSVADGDGDADGNIVDQVEQPLGEAEEGGQSD